MRMRRPFRFRHFEVTQEQVTMPVTTDACLFGMLVDAGHAREVLDIGTGTGLLPLILAARFPQLNCTGIELDPHTAATAAKNFSNSPWPDRLRPVEGDIRTWQPDKPYDLVLSNPPFFDRQLPSQSDNKRQARHTDTLGFRALLEAAEKGLATEGKIWLLLPVLHLEDIRQLAGAMSLHVIEETAVRATDQKPPHISVVCLSRIPSPPQKRQLTMYISPGVYHPDIASLLRPLYPDAHFG